MENIAKNNIWRSLVAVALLTAVASCSNFFSQNSAGTGDLTVAFEAHLLFSETGSGVAGTPYLVPNADRIEATLSRSGGTADTDIVLTRDLTLVAGSDHVLSTVLEFPSVPTNVEHTISLRIFSSTEPDLTLHSGTRTIAPITRSERTEQVSLRLEPGIVDGVAVVDGDDIPVALGAGSFALYQLDVLPGEAHVVSADLDGGLTGELQALILTGSFRRSTIALEDDGNMLLATLPESDRPYYLALFNPAGADPISGFLSLESIGPTEFYVSTTGQSGAAGTFDDPLASIQEAVDRAQPGDFIRLEAGSFDETVIVNKDLTIGGESMVDTLLTSTGSGTTIEITNGAQVSIDNFRVDNQYSGGGARTAVHLDSGSINVVAMELSPGGNPATGSAALRLSSPDAGSSVVVRGSNIFVGESSQIADGVGIFISETYAGTVQIGGPETNDSNIFEFVEGAADDGSGNLHQIFLESDQLAQPAVESVIIQNNTFQRLSVSETGTSSNIYIVYINSPVTILDNSIFGHNPSANGSSVYGIRITSDGELTIGSNFVYMGTLQTVAVTNYGIDIEGGGPPSLIERNRIVMSAIDSQINDGLRLFRGDTTVLNNLIVQDGNGANVGPFNGVAVNASDTLFLHNTVVSTHPNSADSSLLNMSGTGNSLVNNIFLGTAENTNHGVSSASTLDRVHTNVFWNTDMDVQLLNTESLNHAGNMSINPELDLADATVPQAFVPTTSSPALVVSGGVDTFLDPMSPEYVDEASFDLLGNARELTSVTIGAHKLSGSDVIGEQGPAGGWVFYANPSFITDGWRFMEAAPQDYGGGATRPWWTGDNEDVPGTQAGVGAGLENTDAILLARGNPDPPTDDTAAEASSSFSVGGYDDWFLPSEQELVEMFENLHQNGIGVFDTGTEYWSSTQSVNVTQARAVIFFDGMVFNAVKINDNRVRPVRRF